MYHLMIKKLNKTREFQEVKNFLKICKYSGISVTSHGDNSVNPVVDYPELCSRRKGGRELSKDDLAWNYGNRLNCAQN